MTLDNAIKKVIMKSTDKKYFTTYCTAINATAIVGANPDMGSVGWPIAVGDDWLSYRGTGAGGAAITGITNANPIRPTVTFSWGSGPTTSVPGTLFAPPQDNTEKTRIGNKVTLQTIRIRGYINVPPQKSNPTFQNTGLVVRMILVEDSQNNGTSYWDAGYGTAGSPPNPNTFLDLQSGNTPYGAPTPFNINSAVANLNAFQTLGTFQRFSFLRDIIVAVNPNAGNATTVSTASMTFGMKIPWSITVKLNRVVNFSATGTLANAVNGSLNIDYVYNLYAKCNSDQSFGDSAATSTSNPTIQYHSRFGYRDL